jgi:hypothetical protein
MTMRKRGNKMTAVAGIYLALFGRPADPLGLNYFNNATNFGRDFSAVSALSDQSEYKARFSGGTDESIINSIYRSLFNRNADSEGLLYFSNALDRGQLNINTIALSIYDGAIGQDRLVRDTKTQASVLFTQSIDTATEFVGYHGINAANAGVRFLQSVNDSVPSREAIDRAVLEAAGPPIDVPRPSSVDPFIL